MNCRIINLKKALSMDRFNEGNSPPLEISIERIFQQHNFSISPNPLFHYTNGERSERGSFPSGLFY